MWSPLTVAYVLVDLTWSPFCVHIFRRQLQTNMAVRLCDVASLLRSGSWASEPWTGVCGTLISFNHLAWRPAFWLCSGHTNDVSCVIVTFKSNSSHNKFGIQASLGCLWKVNVWLSWYGLNLSFIMAVCTNFIKLICIGVTLICFLHMVTLHTRACCSLP